MTTEFQRMIDLEVESYIHGDEYILPIEQQRELDSLRNKFEGRLKRLDEEIQSIQNLIHEGETGGINLEEYLQNLKAIQGTLQQHTQGAHQ